MSTTLNPRYKFRGLYCPKAADFLPGDKAGDNIFPCVPEFLEACCVRLERLFPDVPHVASLVKEMREFAKNEIIAEFPELDFPQHADYIGGGLPFDETLPE